MQILIANILKWSMGIDEITYLYRRTPLLVLAKSSTGIDEIVYQGNELAFSQYQLTISSILAKDSACTSRRFCQYL